MTSFAAARAALLLSATLATVATGTQAAIADHPGAAEFVDQVVAEHGLDRAQVTALMESAERKQSIIDAITRPAEAKPWHAYRKIFLTDTRIDGGVAFWDEHADLLAAVEKEFGVPVEVVVAIIGVETNYGRITGSYRVVDALATLAFHYPKRADFFRGELEEYLLLGRDEDLPLADLTGSYAGAMGMGQFISSSYRAYAVDFDGDGRRNLWDSKEDAIASVANYFRAHRWHTGEPVVMAVAPKADARELKDLSIKPAYQASQMAEWGWSPTESVAPDALVTLLELEGAEGPQHWLGFHNFYVITRYNRSPLYAMAVWQLAQEIAARRAGS